MKVLVLVLVVAVSQPGLGGIFTRSKCTTVPSNLCAVVYDDEKCNGWALNINEGEVDIFYLHQIFFQFTSDIFKICHIYFQIHQIFISYIYFSYLIRYVYISDNVQVVGPSPLLVQERHRVSLREEGLHLHRLRRQQPQRGQLHHQIRIRSRHVSS